MKKSGFLYKNIVSGHAMPCWALPHGHALAQALWPSTARPRPWAVPWCKAPLPNTAHPLGCVVPGQPSQRTLPAHGLSLFVLGCARRGRPSPIYTPQHTGILRKSKCRQVSSVGDKKVILSISWGDSVRTETNILFLSGSILFWQWLLSLDKKRINFFFFYSVG